MGGSISYGTTNISYSVEFRDRKTMAIEVHPDSRVYIIAPIDTTPEQIQSKVEKRASWIAKQQRFFTKRPFVNEKKEWISGETIYYLGRQYRLKILKGESDISLNGKYLVVSVDNKKNTAQIKALVDAWYLQHARIKFEQRIENIHVLMKREKLEMNSLIIRKLDKRWGSCTPKKKYRN